MTLELFWNTITPSMRSIWEGFSQSEISHEFYLAGGTALALQLGHRYSIDFDFFSPTQTDITLLTEPLKLAFKGYNISQVHNPWGNLILTVENIRVGFYSYGYKMVQPLLESGNLSLSGIKDIGLMKFDALLSRASRKDFYDIYALCQRVSLMDLLALAPDKYPDVRDFEIQVAKRMVYFERADQESGLNLIEKVEWSTVKNWFEDQAKQIGKSWIE
ncbi:MAG: nucleotidyl transferase AbiEii/AbiGii toxin family protein [Chloroflexi bacterium]|nr:nucleotidyl transferase AbiEii/AbiGii toxin family protein [Chloroflexota bacterium]MBI3170621.1 nucleotidyl transferase AbiEii/AbiGii toxin family protein [Chloroflexota bacterium]